MEKKISYLQRDFEGIRSELVKFGQKYYPELSDSYNDSSIMSFFIDLVSAVGDDLSYHTDRMYQETNIDSANLRSTVLNQARTNGLKIPGKKASTCEVELSCVLPTDNTNISLPNWNYAPIVQKTSVVSAGNVNFQLTEDVNFAEQFNSDGYSNRKIVPARNGNGNITGYTVSKSTIVVNGTTKVYKKVISSADLEPFMEVVLPESNVMNVESIIFKETSDLNTTPSTYEYYIDAEEFKVSNEAVMTYRFFECDSLADQYRFGTENTSDDSFVIDMYNPSVYVDYTESVKNEQGVVTGSTKTTRYYRGKWKPLRQKFITEFTDNGFLKIIFGAGNTYNELPSGQTTYADAISSKIVNNDMLGVLPQEGWTMFVLYRVGGGTSTNLAPGAINTITLANVDWGGTSGATDANAGTLRGQVLTSLSVTNLSSALGGKDEPSTDEVKYLMKYNTSSQNRAVTVQDYQIKLMQMPPKYGAPFRCAVAEVNNKVEMDLLGLNADGQLTSYLPQTLVQNILEWMSHYKQINDYIEVRSGKIYNIGIGIDMYADKNYDVGDVVTSVINTVRDYFSVQNHNMGNNIFVGDLFKTINALDGVISIIDLRVYKIWGGAHSMDKCPLPELVDSSVCDTPSTTPFIIDDTAASCTQIDLKAIENVLYSDYNSMYEIKYPASDIQVKVKTM